MGKRPLLAIVALLLSLGLVLGGQAAADIAAPAVPNGALTGQAMGRAGFAYLTGLRQFAAAVLWNRLDPLMDTYYRRNYGLGHMGFMLPSVAAIVALDPHFVEAYYVAPEILIDNGKLPGTPPKIAAERLKTGLALAKEGVVNNPRSGVLLLSYAQLLWTDANQLKPAIALADRAVQKDIIWRADEEEFDSMAIARGIYHAAKLPAKEAAVQAIMAALQKKKDFTYFGRTS